MIALALLAYLPKIILGFSIAHLLWADRKISSLFLKVFLGIPLGMGGTSILLFFSKWAALGRTTYIIIELMTVAAVFIAMLIVCGNIFKEIVFDVDAALIRQNKGVLSVLGLATLISFAEFSITVFMYPHGREDAWSNWNLIARFIYHSDDLSNAFTYIAGSTFPGYPFMMGLEVSNGWMFVNSVTTRIPIALAGLFTFSIPAILFFGLFKNKGIQTASIGTIFVMAPWLSHYGSYLMSDIPTAAFYIGAGVTISFFYSDEDPGLAALAGILAGFPGWVKNDGLPFILITSIVMLLISVKKRNAVGIFRFVLGLAVPLAAMFAYHEFLGVPGNIVTGLNDMLPRLLDLSRIQTVFSFFLQQAYLFGRPAYAYSLILLAILLIGGIDTKNVSALFITAIFLMQYAAYFAVYLITPLDLAWHLSSSMPRVFAQIVPLLIFAVFSLLREQSLFPVKKQRLE